METNRIENNRVAISGTIISNFEFSHEVFGEGFYVAKLENKRMSGNSDIIPIMASDRLLDVTADWIGQNIKISGQFRSCNKHTDGKSQLILSVFIRDCEVISEEIAEAVDDINRICLDGYFCKQPIYRKTPLKREIADVLVAVNRPYGKSDYIPTICWGRNARFASSLEVGTPVHLEGRIQSREYLKKILEGETEKRIAYEISVSKIEVMEETEE